ncbi:MAG: copper-binding protein [Magnetococcales bacterium]|nr:copper-binding protein [Magnetococcales bacterium]
MPKPIRVIALATLAWLVGSTAFADTTAQVTGTLHAVDAQKHVVNIEHPAVPEFKWPAMRMDFTVAREVSLEALKPVQPVQFTITQSDKAGYQITAIRPAR